MCFVAMEVTRRFDDVVGWRSDDPELVWIGGLVADIDPSAFADELTGAMFSVAGTQDASHFITLHLRGLGAGGGRDAAFVTEATEGLLALLRKGLRLQQDQRMLALFSSSATFAEVNAAVLARDLRRAYDLSVSSADYYGPFSVEQEALSIQREDGDPSG